MFRKGCESNHNIPSKIEEEIRRKVFFLLFAGNSRSECSVDSGSSQGVFFLVRITRGVHTDAHWAFQAVDEFMCRKCF